MPRRAERAALAAVVLLLHLLLWWAWPRGSAPARGAPPDAAAPAPLSVRLLAPDAAPQDRASPPDAAPAPRRAQPRAAAAARETAAAPTPTLAISVAPAEPPAASASAPPALDLTLPAAVAAPRSPSLREQWRSDPRANSPRQTIESRVAAVSGSTEMTEERMDDAKTRFRRNGECIEVHVSRDAQTNPWNQNHSPTPKIVKPSC